MPSLTYAVPGNDGDGKARERLDLAVRDLGSTQLKNIAEPIRVYSLQVDPNQEGQKKRSVVGSG